MRGVWRVIVLGAALGGSWVLVSVPTPASTLPVPTCAPGETRITDYNTSVSLGSVNELFWIHSDANHACSLHGYVRVSFIGTYGLTSKGKKPKLLSVGQADTRGASGNDLGGVQRDVAIPTVTLKAKGHASFWIYGTDESHVAANGQSTRCTVSFKMLAWLPRATSSIVVSPMRANGFFWCGGVFVHPIVPGVSGSLPPRPLTYYFGTAR
ncbi:MAG TPA: hypothetical protein VNF05_06220 [Acidimicrobiales bacterium]|nr:hypothetical protein [Acidimicrobiales bacterium]